MAMTSEVLALDTSTSIRMLWARRWALVAVVVLASAVGYLVALALPAVWESQGVLQIGQVGTTPVESGPTLVRSINVGTIQCSENADGASVHLDSVNAQLEGAPDFKEIRLLVRGGTATEADDRAREAVSCLVNRHRARFESATRREKAFRDALQLHLEQGNASVASISRGIDKATSGSTNAAELLLLTTRLSDERMRLLEVAGRLYALEKDHANDTATFVLSEPKPAARIWPRPRLIAALSGAVALLVGACVVLFASEQTRLSRS
jgi:hypothetical protein